MNLGAIVAALETTEETLCIVAKRPWAVDSDAQLIHLTEDDRVPQAVLAAGYEYFLEVTTALEDVLAEGGLSASQRLEALIFYAENDAYPEWLCKLRQVR